MVIKVRLWQLCWVLTFCWFVAGRSWAVDVPEPANIEAWYSNLTPLVGPYYSDPQPSPAYYDWSSAKFPNDSTKKLKSSNYSPSSGTGSFANASTWTASVSTAKIFVFNVVTLSLPVNGVGFDFNFSLTAWQGVSPFVMQGSDFTDLTWSPSSTARPTSWGNKRLLTEVFIPTSSSGTTITYRVDRYVDMFFQSSSTTTLSFPSGPSQGSLQVTAKHGEYLLTSLDAPTQAEYDAHLSNCWAFLLQRRSMPVPNDSNWDLLDDSWETKFPGYTAAGGDDDGDGYSNWRESLLGTSPSAGMEGRISYGAPTGSPTPQGSGSGQVHNFGSALGQPLVVKVTDAQGRANRSAPVEFVVTGSDHSLWLNTASLYADANGLISFSPPANLLPAAFGPYTIHARVYDVLAPPPPAPAPTFSQEVTFGITMNPAKVIVSSGSNQTYNYHATPGQALVGRVTRLDGTPIANAPVAIVVHGPNGNYPLSQLHYSDSSGYVSYSLALADLPDIAGQNYTVEMCLFDALNQTLLEQTPNGFASFNLTVNPLEIYETDGGGSTVGFVTSGTPVGIKVRNSQQAVVANTTVQFKVADARGNFATVNVTTDSTGMATLLPTAAAMRLFAGSTVTVTATLASQPTATSTFSLTLKPVVVEQVDGDNQELYPWDSTLAQPLKVKVSASSDEGGNPIAGWPVKIFRWYGNENGAEVATVTTDSSGVAASGTSILPPTRAAGTVATYELSAAVSVTAANGTVLSENGVFFQVTFRNYYLQKVSGDEQHVEKGTSPGAPMVVRLTNEEGAGVAWQAIYLSSIPDSGPIPYGSFLMYTDADGYAKIWLSAPSATTTSSHYLVYPVAVEDQTHGVTFSLFYDQPGQPFAADPNLRLWCRAESGVDTAANRWYDVRDRSLILKAKMGGLVPGSETRPSIRCDAGLVSSTPYSSPSSDRSVFLVAKRDLTQPVNSPNLISEKTWDSNTGTLGTYETLSLKQYRGVDGWYGSDSYWSQDDLYIPGGMAHVVNFHLQWTGVGKTTVYLDGRPVSNRSTGGTVTTSSGLDVGLFAGDVYEILVFNGTIDEAKRKQVEDYLIAKYGLQAAAASPVGGISGLKAWFRADAKVDANADGTVNSWTDFADPTRVAAQTTVSMKPILQAAGLRGHPTIHFDGTDQLVTGNLLVHSTTDTPEVTIFTVVEPDNATTSSQEILDFQRGLSPFKGFGIRTNTSSHLVLTRTTTSGTATDFPAPATTILQNKPYVWALRNQNNGASGSIDYWFNGTLEHFTTSLELLATPSPGHKFSIGKLASGTGTGFKGDISEVILFNRRLTDAEVAVVQTDLLKRYDIVGPTDDSNSNGVSDLWELTYLGSLTAGTADLDQDGVSNANEYLNGTDPRDYYNGQQPTLTALSGDGQLGTPNGVLPLPFVVKVTNATAPLALAPVTFEVLETDGVLSSPVPGAGEARSLVVRTDASGLAQVYLRLSPSYVNRAVVSAHVTVAGVTQKVTFTAACATPDVTKTRTGDVDIFARSGRFVVDGAERLFVFPMGQFKGVELPATGNLPVTAMAPNATDLWFQRLTRTQVAIPRPPGSTPATITRENPLVAFGAGALSTPFYVGEPYTVALYAGPWFRLFETGFSGDLKVQVYNKQTGAFVTEKVISIPRPEQTFDTTISGHSVMGWDNFANNDYVLDDSLQVADPMGGGTTVLKLRIRQVIGYDKAQKWGVNGSGAPLIIEQTALSKDYGFVVAAYAKPGGLAISDPVSPTVPRALPMYCFDAVPRPPWRVELADTPQFSGEPLPPQYIGKTRTDIVPPSLGSPKVFLQQETFDGVNMTVQSQSTDLTYGPDTFATALSTPDPADESKAINRLLDEMGVTVGSSATTQTAMSLANFVINEIELTDGLQIPEQGLNGYGIGGISNAINAGSANRGPGATLLEKQGSPLEQCALLMHLYRKAGMPAVLMLPQQNDLKMLDSEISQILGVQLHAAIDTDGNPLETAPPIGGNSLTSGRSYSLISVNYPWVAVWVDGNWRYIFPWMKDHAVVEGPDLYAHLPAQYNSGFKIAEAYIRGEREIMQEDLRNVPRTLFPKFLERMLRINAPDVRLDDVGVRVTNRPHNRTRWEDFPHPYSISLVPAAYASVGSHLLPWGELPDFGGVHPPYATMKVTVQSLNNPATGISTAEMYAKDFLNRRFLIQQTPAATPGHWTVTLSLDQSPDLPGTLATGAFDNAATGAAPQSLSFETDATDDQLVVTTQYGRMSLLDVQGGFSLYGGSFSQTLTTTSRILGKAEMAALCFNFGSVTSAMLDIHTDKYRRAQDAARQSGDAIADEVGFGQILHLMGMSYYKHLSDYSVWCEAVHKQRMMSRYAFGLAKLKPKKGTDHQPEVINGHVTYIQPAVDMGLDYSHFLSNGTIHADQNLDTDNARRDFAAMFTVGLSAEEHFAINQLFNQQYAISTVRLLQLAERQKVLGQATTGILELNSTNVLAQGDIHYPSTTPNKPLKEWLAGGDNFGSIWSSILSNLTNSSINGLSLKITGNISPPGLYHLVLRDGAGALIGEVQHTVPPTGEGFFTTVSSLTSAVNNLGLGLYVSSTVDVGTAVSSAKLTIFQWGGPPISVTQDSVAGVTVVPDSAYAKAFVTPVPVTNETASFTGVGALILGTSNCAALISNDYANGGDGEIFYPPLTLYQNGLWTSPDGLSIVEKVDGPQVQVNPSNLLVSGSLTGTATVPTLIEDRHFAEPLTNFSSLSALGSATQWGLQQLQAQYDLDASLDDINRIHVSGPFEIPHDAKLAALLEETSIINYGASRFFEETQKAADPVNMVTGEFLVDHTDLSLPGPIPLALRRNYASFNTGNGYFGFGWSMSIIPYLSDLKASDAAKTPMLVAAEADGNVIVYRSQGVVGGVETYIPTLGDNPFWHNRNEGAAGSTGNLLHNQITREAGFTGEFTLGEKLTLKGADGSVRLFEVRDYPITDTVTKPDANGVMQTVTETIPQRMPYLVSWTDSCGNFLYFTFNSADPLAYDYGKLYRVQSSNGNFLTFTYDTHGHILAASTKDGRRVTYRYDEFGDLTQVDRPDGSWEKYEYWQSVETTYDDPMTHTGEHRGLGSSHLMTREVKPEGRVLKNVYDGSRRVVEQWAPVGNDNTLIKNAAFSYQQPNGSPLVYVPKVAPTGKTVITDAYGKTAVFEYQNGLITVATDRNGATVTTEWYSDNDTVGRRRSIKTITDQRGLVTSFDYDPSGNLTSLIKKGDLDGDGVAGPMEQTTRQMHYNSLNLMDWMVDERGVRNDFTYGADRQQYLVTAVQSTLSGVPLKRSEMHYVDVGTVVTTPGQAPFAACQQDYSSEGTGDVKERYRPVTFNNNGFLTRRTFMPLAPAQGGYNFTTDPSLRLFNVDLYPNARGEVDLKIEPGKTTYFAYDGLGRPIWTEEWGINDLQYFTYTYYNLNGDVAWIDGPASDPEDYTAFLYDSAGRLSEKVQWRSRAKANSHTYTGAGVEAETGDSLYASEHYFYDLNNNLKKVVSPLGHWMEMDYDPEGRVTEKRAYDSTTGRCVSTESFEYEPGGQVSKYTAPNGSVTLTSYTATGQPCFKQFPDGSTWSMRYLSDGRPSLETLPGGTTWTYTYNLGNRQSTKTRSDSAQEITVSDILGRVTNTTDALGNTTVSTYDGVDRIRTWTGPVATASSAQQTLTYGYDPVSGIDSVTNGVGYKVSKRHDFLGRPVSVTSQVTVDGVLTNRTINYSYGFGQHSVTVSETGAPSTTTWADNSGMPVVVATFDPGNTSDFRSTINTYNVAGQLVQTEDQEGKKTQSWYDSLGRPATQRLADGATTNFVYDDAGNLVQRSMPGGLAWKADYDDLGRKTSESLTSGANVTRTHAYTYYPDTSAIGLLQTDTDPRGIVHTYTYDSLRRLTRHKAKDSLLTTSRAMDFGYDILSRVTTVTEKSIAANGAETYVSQVAKVLDGYGQLTLETCYEGTPGSTTIKSKFSQTWDAAGQRLTLADAGGTTALGVGAARTQTFSYREDGLLKGLTANGVAALTDGTGRTLGYEYRASGQWKKRTSRWKNVDVSFNGRGEPSNVVTSSNGVTDLNETLYWSSDSRLSRYDYTAYNWGGSVNVSESRIYEFDDRYRLTKEPFLPAPGQSPMRFQYEYDGNQPGGLGVRTMAVYENSLPDFNGVPHNMWAVDGSPTPLQDAFARPVQEIHTDDFCSPFVSSIVPSTTPPGPVPPGSTSYTAAYEHASLTYDADGNVTVRNFSIPGNNETQTLTWDEFGRLTKVDYRTGSTSANWANGHGYTWTATYDALGRRKLTDYLPLHIGSTGTVVNETANEVKLRSWFDPEVEFLEIAVQAGTGARYWKLYGPDANGIRGGLQGIGGLEAYIVESDATAIGILGNWFGDSLGNCSTTTMLTQGPWWNDARASGWGILPAALKAMVGASKVYGQFASANPVDSTVWRGRRIDPTGLYWIGARYYEPFGGRFISPDPAGHAGSMDLYSYAGGDPINNVDPDGRLAIAMGQFAAPPTPEKTSVLQYLPSGTLTPQESAAAQKISDRYGPLDPFRLNNLSNGTITNIRIAGDLYNIDPQIVASLIAKTTPTINAIHSEQVRIAAKEQEIANREKNGEILWGTIGVLTLPFPELDPEFWLLKGAEELTQGLSTAYKLESLAHDAMAVERAEVTLGGALKPATNAPLLGVDKLENARSMRLVNPLQDLKNCGECAVYGEDIMAGGKAVAAGRSGLTDFDSFERIYGTKWGPKVKTGFTDFVSQELSNLPVGSRGIIFAATKDAVQAIDPAKRVGHYFNFVMRKNGPVFLDFQLGRAVSGNEFLHYQFIRTH